MRPRNLVDTLSRPRRSWASQRAEQLYAPKDSIRYTADTSSNTRYSTGNMHKNIVMVLILCVHSKTTPWAIPTSLDQLMVAVCHRQY